MTVYQSADEPDFRKEYSVMMATVALGNAGRPQDALRLYELLGWEADSIQSQNALVVLTAEVARIGRVTEAFELADHISHQTVLSRSHVLIIMAQARSGDIQGAIRSLDRISDSETKDEAISRICDAYIDRRQFTQASKLAYKMAVGKRRADVLEKIAEESIEPDATDEGYVDFCLETAKSSMIDPPSEESLEIKKHYHRAEAALAKKDQVTFDHEVELGVKQLTDQRQARRELLDFAQLMFKAGRKDRAKQLYQIAFADYASRRSIVSDLGMVFIASENPSHGEAFAQCSTNQELQDAIDLLIKQESTASAAAVLFGERVRRDTSNGADAYWAALDPAKLKAEFAVFALSAIVKDNFK